MSSSACETPARPTVGGTIEVTTLAPAFRRRSRPRMPSTSRDAGIREWGMTRRIVAMVSSSASSPAGRTPASGVPACGTNVMTRTCSHAASRIAAMERARSASVSPIPVRIPSSTSRPARRAARRAATRAANDWPVRRLWYSSGLCVSWYSAYQSAPRARTGTRCTRRRTARSCTRACGPASRSRRAARRAGLLVEDGILTGIGDTEANRARSIAAMREAAWEQVRVMTFVPQAGTPLAGVRPAGDEAELLTIATMRLVMPHSLIPASLDVDGIRGLERRLNAGANVVTSIVPPTVGLAGVSQAELDIDEGRRTVAGVLPHLARLGLRPATVADYRTWLAAAHARAKVPA